MKRILLTALATTFISFPAMAADVYTIEPYHTNVTFKADHFGFSNVTGKFTGFSGTITLDQAAPEKSTFDIKIDTKELFTGISKFDEHLKGADFFNIAVFPTATFTSSKVEVTGKDTAKVTGSLTLMGKTNPVVLDVKLNKIDVSPISNKKTVGFTATATVKRSEFGLSYGLPGVPDDVTLDIEVEANQ